MVAIHPHAKDRAYERGATENEIIDVVETGEIFPAKYGRTGFRKTIIYNRWVLKIQLIPLITSFLFPQKGNDKRKLNF